MKPTRREFLKLFGAGALGASLLGCNSEIFPGIEGPIDNYNMAFIMLGKDSSDFTDTKYDLVEMAKMQFPDTFREATEGLASMDTSYGIVDMIDDGTMVDAQNLIDHNQVARKFYEEHPDEFDFISIYPVYPGESMGGFHNSAQNRIRGIGLGLFDETADYGSTGRLLGVNRQHSQAIQNDSPLEWTPILLQNLLLHETGHQWGVYVGDNFSANPNSILEIKQDSMHFYRGLESPSTITTAMGSDYWVPNGDGTFRREVEFGIRKYHPFQLYFMGLLSQDNYDIEKKFKVFDAGVVGQDFHPDSALPYREISIWDIIKIEGTRTET